MSLHECQVKKQIEHTMIQGFSTIKTHVCLPLKSANKKNLLKMHKSSMKNLTR